MKILVTGAAGFLGRGMVGPLAVNGHQLRLMDVVACDMPPHEAVIGDVSDPAAIVTAMRGVDALVIAHMAPRGADNVNYRTPALPMAVNVGGTANLFQAALDAGVRRVVLISSTAAVEKAGGLEADPTTLPLRTAGWYGLGKAMQEMIAEQFARTTGMQVVSLRVGYILDGDANQDKYGKAVAERNYADTDRRDIGEVARLCLERDDLGYAVFNVMSTQESMQRAAVRLTCERLGWTPRHDFSWLREPATAAVRA
jgi:nucleoside-diphosphate-sugar epimerase